jgi:hypothetical protein
MNFLNKGILVLATMEMAKRKKNTAFCSSEVVKWVYPNDWECFLEEENKALNWLFDNGYISLENGGQSDNMKSADIGFAKIKLCVEALK